MAQHFQRNLIEATAWRDRKVKEAGFYVLKNTKMPAILTENGFYSNQEECLKLLSPEWRDKIAAAHLRAMQEIEVLGYNF